MTRYFKLFLLGIVSLMAALPASAQTRRISGTVSDDIDVVVGANVKEIDKNNRIVSQAVTDFNGNFTMTIKDPKNVLKISYIGYKEWSSPIGAKNVFKVTLQDNTKMLKDVVITEKKKSPTTGLEIPEREFSGAVQNFKMDDMEGLAFESVDQALQGQIAGLDIVTNSGNLGSGTTMRLRGTSTIFGDANPLIVVNDHPFELPEGNRPSSFDGLDNEEQFSALLNVNPEDIESVTVLKDAAATAKWGVQGGNGVIEIKLRRGKRGPTQVNFSYKFTGRWQPSGYKMLNGDEYTMLLKEAYYNPKQPGNMKAIPELDYNQDMPYVYNHFNKNTDWMDEVTQFGKEHRYYINLTGGGEKATFRIGAGYNTSLGSVIGQTMNQFTESTALDYFVSDRIKFSTDINMSFTNNHRNAKDIISAARSAMPNMSVWEYDAMGNLTGNYFNMLPIPSSATTSEGVSGYLNDGNYTSYELKDRFSNGNPVANANLAYNLSKQYNLSPRFSIDYKLLGLDNDHHRLDYRGEVKIDIFNTSSDGFTPAELVPMAWVYGGDNGSNKRNEVSNSENKSMTFNTRHQLQFYPHFNNKDHTLGMSAMFELTTTSNSNQNTSLWNVPNGITDPTVVALLTGAGASNGSSRSQRFREMVHYSYKGRYNLDVTVTTDGRSQYGRGHKYATSYSFGARWNIIDENFMEPLRKVVSMFSIRPSWGLVGTPGSSGDNQYNRYSSWGYYNGHTVIRPENLSLINIRSQKNKDLNIGADLGFLDGLINFDFNYYNRISSDQIMPNLSIPSANGFSSLSSYNGGEMTNEGWELNFSTGKFAKVGKFSMKLRGNISQTFNKINEMNPLILENLNGSETYRPDEGWNSRIQIGNALGSIYGLRSKGVYAYDYEHNGYTNTSFNAYGYNEVDANGNTFKTADEARAFGTGYDKWGNKINTAAAAARRGENATCPIAYDSNGNMMTDYKGNPLAMYYCYTEGQRKQFQGGDAIYEDINHDGNIDRYDMVYLGNSNPTCFGGFGVNFYYGRFELNISFNYRLGHHIVNKARAGYEAMTTNSNQSYATTWRWRKNGDDTLIPRALISSGTNGTYGTANYNQLPSDRYVEKGNYLRMQYIQVRYNFNNKAEWMKKLGIKNLSLSGNIDRPFLWSKYTGIDPEKAPGMYGVASDNDQTPPARSFTCSLNIGF
ncbi:MAG: SusC/RagA family TonB-linked outer membrane protein [Bacteroidales bacterium]|nr:SusC/RagA family TonB-linked outer membrane protein [Candidatus Physcousia equi]